MRELADDGGSITSTLSSSSPFSSSLSPPLANSVVPAAVAAVVVAAVAVGLPLVDGVSPAVERWRGVTVVVVVVGAVIALAGVKPL